MFQCERCGLCCVNLHKSALYTELDRGDGVCRYFDVNSKLCTIYESRPLKCNVDKTYEIYLKNKMSLERYYELNYEACKKLRMEES